MVLYSYRVQGLMKKNKYYKKYKKQIYYKKLKKNIKTTKYNKHNKKLNSKTTKRQHRNRKFANKSSPFDETQGKSIDEENDEDMQCTKGTFVT